MNEYYIALGQEDAKSKFFHLFSIIEYIEHRYEQYNGAIPLYPEETRKEIGDMLQELLAERDDFSTKERKQLCGQERLPGQRILDGRISLRISCST